MISKVEYDFLKRYSDYMGLYKESNIPVVLCDGELNAGWRNPAAETLFPYITDKLHFDVLLGEFKKESILSEIKSGGSVLIDHLVGISDIVLNFMPIIKGGGVYGIVVSLMGPNTVILKPKTRLVSMTPSHIEAGIRNSVTEIFRTVDIAKKTEQQLLQNPELVAAGFDTAFISESLNSITSQAYRLLRIAKNISVYSDMGANPPEPKMMTEDVFEMILSIKDAVKAIAAEMDIPITFSLPETGGTAGLDAEKFELAFFNILNNAFYFTREGNAVKVTGSFDDDEVFVTVADHGIGIPKDVLPEIFEPYFARGNKSRSAGIGLGLTIAKIMIEAQGGRIRVNSIEGEGTEVTLSIPRGASMKRRTNISSGEGMKRLIEDKFSYLYVGLKDAIKSPYNQKNKA